MIFKKNQFSNTVASLGSAKEFLFPSGYAERSDVTLFLLDFISELKN